MGVVSGAMSERWWSSIPLIRVLAGRWTIALLAELSRSDRRYQELHDRLEGISHKVLTDTLRRAERDGLVVRRLDSDRVESATLYQLTPLGRSLDAPLNALGQWVESYRGETEAAHRHWDQRVAEH
ncbi:MAG: helix-turn-helix domain-containing protein [Acidimicrobiales bacterium]|jgi:DNA-binding HxlR family transcriptional regulator